ncbi:MAG: DUF2244 domain-containing protein, partial [Acetobacteraceae bacterium]
MSAFSVPAHRVMAWPTASLRFASPGPSVDGTVTWFLKRNCSFAPGQLLGVYATLCLVSLAIAVGFWVNGAPLVMPFTGIELIAVGLALLFYARHAADRETLRLEPGRLSVECALGGRTERAEFVPRWVRVEPQRGDRSLIELSGQGRSIAVGRFVRPELRRALADELRAALRSDPHGSAAATTGPAVPARNESDLST